MSLYAVFGDPIAQSRSPWIHARFAEQTSVSLRYEARRASLDEFELALADFRSDGGRGANVTAPLKELAATLCSELSPMAHRAGAVNTLIASEAGWIGDNTDGRGLLADLDRQGMRVASARVLMLGAGGAARGALPALLQRQPAELVLANRDPARAQHVAGHLITLGEIRPWAWADLGKAGSFDLVVHATSAGLHGHALALPDGLLARDGAAYDLSYGRAASAFLQWATAASAEVCSDGLGMLVEQAAESFALWHGVRPQTDAVLAELREQVGGWA